MWILPLILRPYSLPGNRDPFFNYAHVDNDSLQESKKRKRKKKKKKNKNLTWKR